jgi:hypothetical protein
MGPRGSNTTWLALAAAAAVGVTVIAAQVAPAAAQGWWPWATPGEAPRPPAPMRPPAPIPGTLPPATGPGASSPFAARPGPPGGNVCQQLEQRLVAETQRNTGNPREAIARIEGDMRTVERQLAQAQMQLERGDCYEYFLFAKSLRNTPQCRTAAGNVESLRRRMGELEAMRAQASGVGEQRMGDDIIRELARNGCGQQYVQEARRLDSSRGPFWSSGEDDPGYRGSGNQFGALPFATYRTVCVRLCDGYYFPVSFSTLPNQFPRDADICQQRCNGGAPVELFYHQNPGGGMEQAISAKTQQAYTQLKTAFRYRKEFVHGCSCKEAEYTPGAGERRADAPAATSSPAQSRPIGSPIR